MICPGCENYQDDSYSLFSSHSKLEQPLSQFPLTQNVSLLKTLGKHSSASLRTPIANIYLSLLGTIDNTSGQSCFKSSLRPVPISLKNFTEN